MTQQEILINWSPQETRVAVVENGAVQELHVERTLERGLVGNIYLGKVARVLPGMQSAFIDVEDLAQRAQLGLCRAKVGRAVLAPGGNDAAHWLHDLGLVRVKEGADGGIALGDPGPLVEERGDGEEWLEADGARCGAEIR